MMLEVKHWQVPTLNNNLLKYVKIWSLKPVLIFDHINIYSFSKIYVAILFQNFSNFLINIKVYFRAMIHLSVSEIIIWDFSLQVITWYFIHIPLANYLFSQCFFWYFYYGYIELEKEFEYVLVCSPSLNRNIDNFMKKWYWHPERFFLALHSMVDI